MADLEALWEPSPPKKKKMKKTPRNILEAAVQRECLEWLMAHKDVVYVERRNTGALTTTGGGFIKFGSPGAADIWCLIRPYQDNHGGLLFWKRNPVPLHIEIECKRRDGKGRLSENQAAFKQRCEKIGVPYLVVTSAADLDKQFRLKLFIHP